MSNRALPEPSPRTVNLAHAATWDDTVAQLLGAVSALVPQMQSHGRSLDQQDAFPAADLAALREAGVLRAPLPRWAGGLGLGTEPEGGAGLFALLRQLGAGSLAVGRIIEGHVNALQLICRYGEDAHSVRAAADAEQGHLFAIWNTEPPPGVRLSESGRLIGQKFHVSAAGRATRPLITVDHPNRSRLLLLSLKPGERATLDPHSMHGMRATQSGAIDLTGYHPQQGDWIGQDGDYLREPIFSAGAWRALAVMVGGITALVDELRGQLRARGRDAAPHQAARIAGALIAQETAALWARKAALLAESGDADPADITGYVALARRAVERAAQEAIALTQCALGLAALMEGNPAERLMRDLATYLRQPALDEALDEAAAHYAATPLPDAP